MSATIAYAAPTFMSFEDFEAQFDPENEAIPAFIIAAAHIVGLSVPLAAWVCTVPCQGQCRSLWNTVKTLGKWLTVGC